ncbi:MAG: hypothetical protein RSD55_04290, partial [Lachnospiraceae bacterium]
MKKYRKIILGLMMIFVLGLATGCGTTTDENGKDTTENKRDDDGDGVVDEAGEDLADDMNDVVNGAENAVDDVGDAI